MKVKLVFPGQGSQYVGMGKELYEKDKRIRELYDSAEEITGLPVKRVSFEGPEEELKKTYLTQVAIYVHSVALFLLYGKELEISAMAGHSLGELTALYAGGVYDFEQGLRIVARRGELMFRAGEKNPGTMAAIIGLNREEIEVAIKEIEGVVVANHNSPAQTVISGTLNGVNEAVKVLKDRGARRAVILKVSGAFHSPLLKETSEEFSKFLQKIPFRDSKVDIIQNISGEPERKGEKLKEGLIKQLISPVEWVKSIERLNQYEGKFVECGPSSVLCNLIRRTISVECMKIEDIRR